MLLPFSRDRRIVGRSQGARLHRDAAACSRGGAQRHALLAGTARRNREFERSADALADRIGAIAGECARRARFGSAGMGRRAVPSARIPARAMERHS